MRRNENNAVIFYIYRETREFPQLAAKFVHLFCFHKGAETTEHTLGQIEPIYRIDYRPIFHFLYISKYTTLDRHNRRI